MFQRGIACAALTAAPFVALLGVSAASVHLVSQHVDARGAAEPGAKDGKLKALQKERLAAVRELAKLATDRYKTGSVSEDEVREAIRMVLAAELEQCDSDKDRVAVLEKVVAEAKKLEDRVAQLHKAGQAPFGATLKAKADRLQAEIALERARTKEVGGAALETDAQVALAEKHVAIKQAASKVAEAQRKVVLAQATSVRAQVAEAQAAEALAAKQFKRLQELERHKAVAAEQVEESQARWEAAKARRLAAEGKVLELEAQALLEQARAELARRELEEAELRLKQLKDSHERKPGATER
jgi:hypothetical protein